MLHGVAECFIVWQCVVVRCSVLQCAAVCCKVTSSEVLVRPCRCAFLSGYVEVVCCSGVVQRVAAC